MKLRDKIVLFTMLGGMTFTMSSCDFIHRIIHRGVPTAMDTKFIKEFHEINFLTPDDMLEEDNLSLYVDNSSCITLGQNSPFYQSLVPSFVDATKTYYSIKGSDIVKEETPDTYNRLLNIVNVDYAELRKAAEEIANGKGEGVLLTDGEYYNPTIAGANPNNPYLAKAFKTWMKRGHDIYIISEPYVEPHNGNNYQKKRFYFLFTDSRLKNNIYDRIRQTAKLEDFPDVHLFHLSADHPSLMSKNGLTTEPNPLLAASVATDKKYGFEVQDWTVGWDQIENFIMGAVDEKTGQPLPNGDYVIKGLKVDRNSFGGYKIKDVRSTVSPLNVEYTSFYDGKEGQLKPGKISQPLDEITTFLVVDKKEFEKHGIVNLYFDINNLTNSFLDGNPFNYFKIDLFIDNIETVFQNYREMFTFDLLGQPGRINQSVAASVEQCLTDEDLQNQMKHSPIYSIYVKSNKHK